MKKWLKAFRLRTLPLAFSCIITGTALAVKEEVFDAITFSLALVTTLFLQILSNLANDYGDAEKGTDNDQRLGPVRAIQSGEISKEQMKKAIVLFVLFSLVSGLSLVFYATRNLPLLYSVSFIVIGLLSIIAAIKYTAGKSAYGYKGMGDLFVFIFFGLVGVLGSYLLYGGALRGEYVLPSITIGLFSTAVLNLNNMRDIVNDKLSGKNTLVVMIGLKKAKAYHVFLLVTGMFSAFYFWFLGDRTLFNLIFTLSFIPLAINSWRVSKVENPQKYDPMLKHIAMSTFLFSILFLIALFS